MNSANEMVNFVATVLHSGIKSCLGRNVQFLCERYNVSTLDICQ